MVSVVSSHHACRSRVRSVLGLHDRDLAANLHGCFSLPALRALFGVSEGTFTCAVLCCAVVALQHTGLCVHFKVKLSAVATDPERFLTYGPPGHASAKPLKATCSGACVPLQ
jgi:hypothetical protein